MKKILITLALLVSMTGALIAQSSGSTIGLRLGYPTEISYQTALSNTNRLELGLGFRSYGYAYSYNYAVFSLSGMYQWIWNLAALGNGFNWYAGLGASLGYYSYSYLNYGYSGFPISILGQVGVEYNFNFPLRVSLDYRPGVQITNGAGFLYDGVALGLRYRIKD